MCTSLLSRLFRKGKKLPPISMGYNNGEDFIDLGLSVRWGIRNIGADISEQAGSYYNYDEIEGKYNLPTSDEVRELFEKCVIRYDKKKGGFSVKGPNGNMLFFPVGGERGGNAHYEGSYFWTCSDYEEGYMEGYKYYGGIYVVNKVLKTVKKELNLLKRDGFWINVREVQR